MSDANDPNDPANAASYHTGKPCIELGCMEPAGTAWSSYWCQRHNAERLDRISASLDQMIGRKEPPMTDPKDAAEVLAEALRDVFAGTTLVAIGETASWGQLFAKRLAPVLAARGYVLQPAPSASEALLRKLALEWRDAEDAYADLLDQGPVVPPAEPDFGPWERRRAATRALRAALAVVPQEGER